MEETPEGLAAAKATRERARQAVQQLAQKRPAPDNADTSVPPKKPQELRPAIATSITGTMHDPQWRGTMAKAYPFTLDPFQAAAIACLERKESVLVAAHTSAGKTVVAEYAIAMAFRDKQRVVYTSPIKALSNQKFRELSEEFEDVGIMTGDVTINPNASCLVMTTEILRSMIYRQGELMEEMAWVIFDEVHYMQDRERGVVWEETIIFLPRQTRMVFLSATLSNSRQFAGWVTHLHAQPCHVVYTDTRPTPLQHYLYPKGGEGLHLVKNERGVWSDKGYQAAMQVLQTEDEAPSGTPVGGEAAAPSSAKGKGPSRRPGAHGADLVRLVKAVKAKSWAPVIIFSFARRECELYSRTLVKEVDLTTDEEKAFIEEVFLNAIQSLSPEDQQLPFLQSMLPILKRGIGVHHGGLLPILKELVELLFSDALLKVLFATETFAMGLNMPARTVVFTSLKKFDGEAMRYMTSGEYIQMSGRAGRRGKDDKGIVIMMVEEALPKDTCQGMMQGSPGPLNSQFKLSYYTLLNVLRRQGSTANMEYVISNSFQQFQWEQQVPGLQARLGAVEDELKGMGSVDTASVERYIALRASVAQHEATLVQAMLRPDKCLHFLTPGRLIKVKEGEVQWGWGVVVAVNRMTTGKRKQQPTADALGGAAAAYTVDTLLRCSKQHAGSLGTRPQPAQGPDDAELQVVPVPLPLLSEISLLRITVPADLRPSDNRKAVLLSLQELEARYDGLLPPLDPVADMGITDPSALEAIKSIKEAEKDLKTNTFFVASIKGSSRDVQQYRAKAQLLAEADELQAQLKESHVAAFRDEVRRRTAVLRRLGHLSEEGVVTLKGRAACEIDTADELLATELMFNDAFRGLDPPQLAALVSCLVPVERTQDAIKLSNELAGALRTLQDTARHIAEVSNECKVEVQEEEYVESFRAVLMDVIHAWSKGESFAKICSMTELFEGSIIRATRRLVELMHQMEAAAKAMGDEDLAVKFAESVATIKRDIMFAASLYI